MIEQLKYIRNVGRFAQVQGQPDLTLNKLTLVYSENARGKTTVCAILRSLSTGDSGPILERHRLSATSEAKVVLVVDGSDVIFDGKAWSTNGPPVLVFDEHFVDANVHSGLSIEAGHRQNLHVLVIGEEGVRYQRRVEALGDEITRLQSTVREQQAAIPVETRGNLSVDAFCALPPVKDIAAKIAEMKRSVSVLRDAQKVRDTPEFTAFALPRLRADDVRNVLRAALPDMEQAAVTAVSAHFDKIGVRAESWVSEGVERLGAKEQCPFCGQKTTGLSLIAHYRAYFSKEYRNHKTRIANAKASLDKNLGGDALARIQRIMQQAKERHAFWAKYVVAVVSLSARSQSWQRTGREGRLAHPKR